LHSPPQAKGMAPYKVTEAGSREMPGPGVEINPDIFRPPVYLVCHCHKKLDYSRIDSFAMLR